MFGEDAVVEEQYDDAADITQVLVLRYTTYFMKRVCICKRSAYKIMTLETFRFANVLPWSPKASILLPS